MFRPPSNGAEAGTYSQKDHGTEMFNILDSMTLMLIGVAALTVILAVLDLRFRYARIVSPERPTTPTRQAHAYMADHPVYDERQDMFKHGATHLVLVYGIPLGLWIILAIAVWDGTPSLSSTFSEIAFFVLVIACMLATVFMIWRTVSSARKYKKAMRHRAARRA